MQNKINFWHNICIDEYLKSKILYSTMAFGERYNEDITSRYATDSHTIQVLNSKSFTILLYIWNRSLQW